MFYVSPNFFMHLKRDIYVVQIILLNIFPLTIAASVLSCSSNKFERNFLKITLVISSTKKFSSYIMEISFSPRVIGLQMKWNLEYLTMLVYSVLFQYNVCCYVLPFSSYAKHFIPYLNSLINFSIWWYGFPATFLELRSNNSKRQNK